MAREEVSSGLKIIKKEEINYDGYILPKLLIKPGIEQYQALPQIGDILLGIISSIQLYGYFIDIADCVSEGLEDFPDKISGLLHNSNIKTHHPFSITNPQLIKKFGLMNRKVYVEIIDVSEKGYSLEEVYDTFNYTIEDLNISDILFQESYFTFEDFRLLLDKNRNIGTSQYKPLEEKNIIYFKNVIVCDDDIYYLTPLIKIKYHEDDSVYMSKDYKAILMSDEKIVGFYEADTVIVNDKKDLSFDYIPLMTEKEIEQYNNKKLKEAKKTINRWQEFDIEQEKEKEEFNLFIKEVETQGPNKVLQVYLKEVRRVSEGRKYNDRSTSTSTYNEDSPKNCIIVEVYNYQDQEFYKIDGTWGKYSKRSDAMKKQFKIKKTWSMSPIQWRKDYFLIEEIFGYNSTQYWYYYSSY